MHGANEVKTTEEKSQLTVASVFANALRQLGVVQAYGVMGGPIAPFLKAVWDVGIEVIHTRHEAGAAFAAIEASLITRKPVLVFVTSGPGLANVLNGMVAARWEGAHVVFVSACSSPAQRGRVATQETSDQTMFGTGVFSAGGPLDLAVTVDYPQQLLTTLSKLTAGLDRAQGFVAHVSLSSSAMNAACSSPILARPHKPAPDADLAAAHASLLSNGRFVIWLGYGSRHSSELVRRFAERSGARVMCSPRAKGIFPENHPLFLGVTGVAGHDSVERYFEEQRPEYVLVLGSRLGESTSFWNKSLQPQTAFLHVDVDASVFGLAYPECTTIGVVANIEDYMRSLLHHYNAPADAPAVYERTARAELSPRSSDLVRPQFLLQEVQRVLVESADAWVIAESGSSFCWTNHLLQINSPGRYRVSTGYGSMGHATSGVVGAALARKGKAVSISGDGAMLMLNEVHTAVQFGADAVWIVLNDACYLICDEGMRAMGWTPFLCELPRVDFVGLAESLGARGLRVRRECDVREALECAARVRGPFVLDVSTDRSEKAPADRRNQSLIQQARQG